MENSEILYGTTADFLFWEAVKFLEEKTALPPEAYKRLAEECRAKAFTVAGFESAKVLQKFLDELASALAKGKTFEQFKSEMESFLERNGYEKLHPARLITIFQTNMQTAYHAGHYRSMTDKTVRKLRPYWQYVTAGDGRVRDAHAAMDGRVYRADDPIWDVWYPPNGFRCRCMVISLSPAQMEQRGLTVETKAPELLDMDTGEVKMAFPDKGFSKNPAKASWKPDTSGFSKEVRELYENRKR